MADVKTGYTVEIVGLDEFLKQVEDSPEIVDKHMRKAMGKSVLTVEKNVIPLVPVFTGRLQDSIGSEVTGFAGSIQGKVGSSLRGELYPSVMEFGRRPNRTPPPWRPIARWLYIKKGVPNDKNIKWIAINYAKKIGKHGIKGKRYMERGYKQSVTAILKYFDGASGAIIEEIAE